MIYLCYKATHQATYALANGVLFRFPNSATNGHRFIEVLWMNATRVTRDEKRLAHYLPECRALSWFLKTRLTRSRECSLHHFGTVVEAAV
jgi:hypothetical protein